MRKWALVGFGVGVCAVFVGFAIGFIIAVAGENPHDGSHPILTALATVLWPTRLLDSYGPFIAFFGFGPWAFWTEVFGNGIIFAGLAFALAAIMRSRPFAGRKSN